MQGLREMGFTEVEEMRSALLRSNGQHEVAVQMMLDTQQARPPQGSAADVRRPSRGSRGSDLSE